MSKSIEKKLNIAIICDPIDYVAGAFVSVLRFTEQLRLRGHNVVIIASRTPKYPKDNEYQGAKIYRFFSVLVPKTEKDFYIAFPSKRQLKEVFEKEKIDVVHTILPTPLTIIAIRAARELKIPVVAHSHAQPENVFLHIPKIFSFLIKPLNKLYDTYMAWIYKNADTIIYPTRFAQNLFPQLNDITETTVISNGVDVNRFRPFDAQTFFEKFNLSRERKNVLYVGRLHPEKSVHTFIHAAVHMRELSPNACMWIVGDGHQADELKRLAASLKLDGHLHFLGKISNEDLIYAYNACDIFVLPSLAELEGMVVLEAMACGKPVVVANSPTSASPFLVEENGLLFEPENAEDLARCLAKMCVDDALRAQMAKQSLVNSKKYDIRESVSRLEEVYNKALHMYDE